MSAYAAMLCRIGLLMLALCAAAASAQSADPGPQLRAQAHMAASGDLMVGATGTLQVDVLTTTWFTQPPVLPVVDIAGALVSGPAGEATLIRTTVEGVSYSGLRYAYQVSPTAAGELRVPAIEVQAQVGQATAPLTARTNPQVVPASGPPGAAAGHVLAANAVEATQQIEFSSQPLAVGGHVRRVITVRAQGAQAMLIPPPDVSAAPGLKSYAAEPVLTTLTDSRGGFVGGQRVDRFDYVIGQAGVYDLPAVQIHWWNVGTGKQERVVLPAQHFEATGGAAYQMPFAVEQDLRDMGRQVQGRVPGGWAAVIAAVFGLALWLALPLLRRACKGLQTLLGARRRRWRASEHYAAFAARRELAGPADRLDALYRWLWRSNGAVALAQGTARLSPELRLPGADALRDCFGPQPDAPRGLHTLREVFPRWRRALRIGRSPTPGAGSLLPLNPCSSNRDHRAIIHGGTS
ncbi:MULTISPECIES: hypothetical protein [Achromobacter]|uniref:hypothetical protein n=1 Tax=Achromobacter TaxID=222 RepID=UPI0025C621C6|nr:MULTISPECIES: hypothetical protein [Achromobacter]